MLHHPLTNFEIQRYFLKTKSNAVYSRNNLPEIKYLAYIINLDVHRSIGAHWIVLSGNSNNTTNFDSLGIEYIPKAMNNFKGNKNHNKHFQNAGWFYGYI